MCWHRFFFFFSLIVIYYFPIKILTSNIKTYVRTYTCLSDGAKRRAFDLERWKNSYALSAIQFHIRLAVLVESQGLTKFCKV
jgi:hypothetical protein